MPDNKRADQHQPMSYTPVYSIIIPVYNRPTEVDELLASLLTQDFKDFEVIIVEDGSSIRCDQIVDTYRDKLRIHYFFKPNSGPGPTRNYGFEKANGKYFVIFDSDCIIPSAYFSALERSISENSWDAWGGPDRAHENFTPIQRATGYTMASVLTTGGIRGGKKHVGWFQPRSFNMGMTARVFKETQGFKFTRFAEDIELSIRMKKAGYNIGLIPDAFVYHKRRVNFSQFYKQVFNFGKGRVRIAQAHPGEVKLTHWFPAIALLATIGLIIMPFINITLFRIGAALLGIYLAAIFIHALIQNKSLLVALLAVPAALLQLWGYGAGFLSEKLKKVRPGVL